MLETSARLLRLLALLQARLDWPGTELAARLGVSPRTLRRDVDKLRSLGYPVDAVPRRAAEVTGSARARRYPRCCSTTTKPSQPRSGCAPRPAGPSPGSRRLRSARWSSWNRCFPPGCATGSARCTRSPCRCPAAGPPVDPQVLTVIATAARDQQRIRFGYTSHDGTLGSRAAEPHHLVHTGRRWYLLAWDPARDGWRTFRADRITSPLITGPRFTPRDPPGGDAAAYVSRSISSAPYRYQARIRLRLPAQAAAERLPPTVGHLQADGEHGCILHTGAESPDMLAIYVAILGAEFEILDPPELAEHILTLAGRLTRAARR